MGHGVGHHIDISIHALREEGDAGVFSQIVDLGVFLSTPSARRATPTAVCDERSQTISIHALREEGDGCHQFSPPRDTLFLSTPSVRRATVFQNSSLQRQFVFLSTPSARRAT